MQPGKSEQAHTNTRHRHTQLTPSFTRSHTNTSTCQFLSTHKLQTSLSSPMQTPVSSFDLFSFFNPVCPSCSFLVCSRHFCSCVWGQSFFLDCARSCFLVLPIMAISTQSTHPLACSWSRLVLFHTGFLYKIKRRLSEGALAAKCRNHKKGKRKETWTQINRKKTRCSGKKK